MTPGAATPDPAPPSAHPDVPVERRVYFPVPAFRGSGGEPCPFCGRATLNPWYLHRDRERRVWRRWICHTCQRDLDRPKEESA